MKRESPSEQRQCEGAATSTQKEKDTAAVDGAKAGAGAKPAPRTALGVRNANLVFGAELLADSFHILAQKHLRPIARFPHQHLVALGALPHLVLRRSVRLSLIDGCDRGQQARVAVNIGKRALVRIWNAKNLRLRNNDRHHVVLVGALDADLRHVDAKLHGSVVLEPRLLVADVDAEQHVGSVVVNLGDVVVHALDRSQLGDLRIPREIRGLFLLAAPDKARESEHAGKRKANEAFPIHRPQPPRCTRK